ncbi:hypothetical protein SFRURICE_012479 [Spodoptera frugiperda]|nr:hypothetical protein SFRURICE_012479 [Spodoptera frugiperda]
MYHIEEDLELPEVLFDSADDSSTFEMPSAEELVEQRAKELAYYVELQRLRELEEGDEAAHEVLSAELSGLLCRPQAPRPAAADLWAALAPHVPGAPTGDEAPMLQAGLLEAQMPQIVRALAAGVKSAARWSDADMLGSCALLTVAVLMENSPYRRKAVRTLHALLDRYAKREQLMAVAYMMVMAFPAGSAARLELSDQVCSGSCSGGDRIAYILNSTAMLDLLGAGGATFCAPSFMQVVRAAARWRQCEPAAQLRCIQLAGRMLTESLGGGSPETEPEERAELLDHLRPDPDMASDTPQKDRLKVSL